MTLTGAVLLPSDRLTSLEGLRAHPRLLHHRRAEVRDHLSLYTYLGEHPRVFMPELKEPHYFSRDLPGLTQIGKQGEYLSLFASAAAGALRGEASVWYLFSEAAVPAIAAANPAAKLIVLLRNPIDAAYSLHAHFLWTLRENQKEFATAWALQDERRRGRELPS